MAALEGETVIVTGASRGLGKAMAIRFSKEGANVALVSRTRERLEAVAGAAPGETLVLPTDVQGPADVERAVERTAERFGRVDALVNNAGVGQPSLTGELKPIVDVGIEEWRTIIETNVTGVFLFTRATLPGMIERGSGHVINISSGMGRRGEPRWTPYVTSKWALEGMTRSVALEVESAGVLVNALDPGGPVETAFWEGRDVELLEPTVMNDAAVLLASQGPDGVTGESMNAEDWERRLR